MGKVRTYSLLLLLLVTMTSLHAQSGAAFYLENGSTMTLGNNIIVNNGNANVNGTVSPYNLIVNGDNIFVDRESDFTLFYLSMAIDAGYNSFCSWLLDMNDTSRFINATVDLGAFEYVDMLHKRLFAVHQKSGGTLTLCNNIIVNNPAHTLMTNCGELLPDNILSDSLPLFHDSQFDFSLLGASPAVDAGRDPCNNLARDMQDKPRKSAENIDVGAFESKVEIIQADSAYVVFQNQEGPMVFCNNIDINNCVYAQNTNLPQVQSNNIVTDNDSLFMDNIDNFRPRPLSEAIDNGDAGCNNLERDLSDNDRIMGTAIDIGAYEQYVQDTITTYLQYVVHQMSTGSLQLCNNIIVNNPSHDDVMNIDVVPSNNILSDSIPIFCDANLNFKPCEGSPAVDAGMSGCNGLAVDLEMLPRIARTAIDIGAFELPDRDDSIAGGGGWGGGSGWGLADPTSDYYHTTVFQHGGDSLLLCNNIIINNSVYIANAYTTADSTSNILTDSDTLFVDNVENYMPRETSLAVNTGDNSCNELEKDLHNHSRIYQEIIDKGAYEQFSDEDDSLQYNMVLHQVGNGMLLLCNNIIVNNPAHTELSNIENIPDNNILLDSLMVFRDALYDFSLWPQSPAVDAGQNGCCSLMEDLERKSRIIGDTIDVGAFEFVAQESYSDTTCIVWQGDTAELLLCNNIVINNCMHSFNANVSASSSHNILEDSDSIFTDNQNNFLPLPQSVAVNQGSNECNEVAVDLAKHTRIMADIIDVGAYEQFEAGDDSPPIAAVHQVDTLHELRLYNNIVIQNPYHTHNFLGTTVGSHNLLEDTTDVFVDITSNFSLMQNSPAINAGDNQYVSWPWDIKHDSRISCADVVDQGAFEYTLDNVSVSLTYSEISSDNCQGSYILLQATPGAQHYYWSHANEDTCSLIVTPFVSTDYTVIASNGGECVDTAMVHVIPDMSLPDTLGSPSSIGKVFWLSYLHNHFRPPTLTLLLSAEQACSGTVSNPLTGWSTAFTVAAHSVSTVQISLEQAYPENVDEVANFGILVTADDSISVYAANYNTNSFDVTNVLPVNALSDEYLLQTYTPMMNAEFVVVATEDNTIVEITPSKALEGGHAANHTFTIVLQQGQTYLGKSRFGGTLGDLSGTVVKSLYNKPIAVFNGNVCAMVPSTNSYTDHLVEQAVGVNYWGRSFAITSTESQNFDVVRVTALRDNTEIRKNGVLMATIQAHQTWEHQLSGAEGSCYLETSKPVGVYLYIAGAVLGNPQEMSDPSMIWIPPTEQKLNDLTFATFNSPGISNHYVNIVVPAESVNDVILDGVSIGGQFSLLSGSPDFAFLRKQIANGTHTLHCGGGFIAHCYGLGYHESYGYAAGYKTVPLTEQLLVNGILNSDLPPDTKFCPYEPITFEVNTNYPCDSVTWNFGDGSPMGNGMSLVHDFGTSGTYTVIATLYITSDETVFCSNLYVQIRIEEGAITTYYDTICQGIAYQANGFDIPSSESGHYTYTRTATVSDQYCDSTFVLELEVRDNYLVVQDTVCVNSHYEAYGFDLTPTQLGSFVDTIHLGAGAFGCDSLVILQLVVSPNTDSPPTLEGEGWPCQGGTYTYAIDSLSGLQEVVWTVPDSVIVLSQQNPYEITLMFDTYADSFAICVTAQGGCGVLNWCRTVYPQPYNYVQIFDTLCVNVNEYSRYGFELTNVSDSNDLFIRHDTAAGGCDSTTVLRLIFVPTYEMNDTLILCENEYPYIYHDTLLADTGFYQIMLASEFGCDSLVNLMALSKPIHHTHFYDTVCNAKEWYDSIYTISGDYDVLLENGYGRDSLVTMHLTVYHSDTVAVDSVVCRNELPVLWNGVTFADAGTNTAMLVNGHGCDSVVAMTLVVNELSDSTLTMYMLENDMPFVLNEIIYDTSGTYTQVLPNAMGCDSVLTIELTVLNNVTGAADSIVCESELPIVWNGVTFEETGTQFAVLEAASGADSTVVMNLTVVPTTYGTFDTTIVENALPCQYNDISYFEAGIYTQNLTNAAGCDSILTVLIDVIENVSVSLDSTVCETALPLTWNDSIFTAAGTKATTVLAANGADSTITMVLTVISTVTELVEVTACESYNWNGTNYTESGDYPQTFTAAGGCDSIVTLHLTVHHGTHNATTETACDSYEWHDSAYTASGVYTYEYTNADGCPSADTLHLVVIPLPELTLSPDTTIIFGTSVSLWASGADYYQWLPTDGLSNPNSATPLASPLQPTCYQVTGYAAPAEQDNMVVNGGFEAGYTGFTTDYNYVANPSQHNLGFGNFVINEDAHNVWPLQHQYGYGGDGLFMIVDGASSPNATVWSQTVNVQPNTSYNFSAQIVSLCASDISVARLQFVVNGVQLGPVFEAPSTLYQWVKFHDFWNSGNDTVATITILNQNTNGQGNDFGLDDIVFAPMPECFVTDSVCVSVFYNVVDTMTICESELPYEWNGVMFMQAGSQTATLVAATGADSVVTMTLTVIPTTYGTFDTTIIENALPLQYNEISYFEAGTYTQHLTNAAGCDSILALTLTVFPNVTTELDSTVCESDLPVIWNGIAFTAAGTDSVTLLAATGADSTVVMTLHVVALPVLTHSADTVIMPGASVNLWATGSDIMAWTDADGNPLSSGGNLTVAPTATTTYYITAFNEGNSVVTNGDFESGNTGFTTAYQYNSNLWPEGNYYVGTNAHNHHGNFPNWYDHTTGNGLYMIVNGATVAGTNLWTQTVPVIPHTSYAFSAWVCTLVGGYSALARLQFSVNATQLGDIFHSPSSTSVWNRYYEVWYSGENTTATLTILNQNTTGGGNDFGVDDIQFSPLNFCNVTDSVTVYVSGQTDSTVCADALPLLWNGVEFTSAGTQTATITTPDGSDSVVVMTLHVNALSYNTFDTAVVENALPLQYNGISYIEAGTYTQYLTNAAGCDSILTVNLAVFPNVTSELDSAVCETAFPFTWNDSVFTTAGTKTTTVLAHTGANSTITMTVTMLPTTYGSFDTVIVENALPLQYNGISYVEAGTYTQYLTNAAGCDSVLTVLIDVIENVSVSVDSTVCEAALPLTWNDSVFTAAGTKTTTILAHTGADSTITMTLTVIPTTYSIFDTAVIENALPCQYNEISYVEAGTYTQNFTNALGCDSILTVHLTVYQNVTTTVDTTVCASDLPYTWHGHSFTAAGTHMVTLLTSHGADSVVTYHLSVDNISANIGNVTHITCYGESTGAATATVTGGQTPMTYAWTNASGTNIATTTSIGNRPAGAYTFTVTDHIGCTATASLTLNTLNGELQPGTIAASQEVCDGEDIAPFTGTAASGGNNGAYQWQISTNGTDWTPAPGTNNAQTYTYPNSATNSFSLRRSWVSQSCGTVYSNIVTVSVWPNSIDTITASVCQGEIYNEYNFDISTDQTAVTGEYTYEQHHATGHCDSAVILLLTVNPVVAELVEATVCEGEGYDANGFEVSTQETIGESVLTRVQNLQTVNGCDSVVTLQLTIIDTALRVEMLTDDFCEHNEASLTVLSPMQDYVWSTGETATTIVVTSPGIYSVTASEGGCSATAHIRVEGCHYELVLPNAITPSRGDGLNDCFYIPEGFTPNINLFKVYIYNRWGELVFYSTDKNFRWYGEYRGQTQYQTIYNYVIEYTDTAGRPQRLVGSITVL